jgi:hypothetical protein
MPGGICSANFQGAVSSPRCSLLSINVYGVRRQLAMGGFAEAYFPAKDLSEIALMQATESLEVVWERAVFWGRDKWLGDVVARLDSNKLNTFPKSLVNGLADHGSGPFLPAVNRNYLCFDLHVPRFNMTLTSDQPIINSSIISQIPPFGSVYELEKPVSYRVHGNGILSGFATLEIEKCSVKLVEIRNIFVEVIRTQSNTSSVSFTAKIQNGTTEDEITVVWVVWPEDGGAENIYGILSLKREYVTIKFELPSNVLNSERWFGISIVSPFHTEAANIVRLN